MNAELHHLRSLHVDDLNRRSGNIQDGYNFYNKAKAKSKQAMFKTRVFDIFD